MSRILFGVLMVGAALALTAAPASAHGARVGIGVGIGFPVFAYPPPVYVPPPPRVVYYPPPPVVYAPPPPSPGLYADPSGPAYIGPNGGYCREFQSSAMIGGRMQPVYGTACQQPDGSWRVVR